MLSWVRAPNKLHHRAQHKVTTTAEGEVVALILPCDDVMRSYMGKSVHAARPRDYARSDRFRGSDSDGDEG